MAVGQALLMSLVRLGMGDSKRSWRSLVLLPVGKVRKVRLLGKVGKTWNVTMVTKLGKLPSSSLPSSSTQNMEACCFFCLIQALECIRWFRFWHKEIG